MYSIRQMASIPVVQDVSSLMMGYMVGEGGWEM